MKEFVRRLKNPVVISSIVAVIYILVAPSLNFPDWAEVSTQVIAFVYGMFGITNNPTSKDSF